MSATDELRRMLDERGVEHYDGTESTLWGYEDYNEFTGIYRFSADETSDGYMQVRLWRVTPEQAIAATLWRGMLTADDVRDLIERHSDASGGNGRDFHNGAYLAIADELNATLGSFNCTNSERTNGTCLPYWWTHDGTLHVELPKLPESISVRLPDQRDREVGSARTWQYTLGNDGVGRTNDGLADLQAENAKLRELMQEALASHEKMCTQRGNCFGCQFFETEWSRACPIVTVNRSARELGIEVE